MGPENYQAKYAKNDFVEINPVKTAITAVFVCT